MDAIERLEEEMIARGVKPHKVRSTMASVTGLTPQSVHAWFQGATKKPSAEHLLLLAEYYGLNYRWVITGTGEKFSRSVDSEDEAEVLDLLRLLPDDLRAVAVRQLQALADTSPQDK